jgi:hypothetical protein
LHITFLVHTAYFTLLTAYGILLTNLGVIHVSSREKTGSNSGKNQSVI